MVNIREQPLSPIKKTGNNNARQCMIERVFNGYQMSSVAYMECSLEMHFFLSCTGKMLQIPAYGCGNLSVYRLPEI